MEARSLCEGDLRMTASPVDVLSRSADFVVALAPWLRLPEKRALRASAAALAALLRPWLREHSQVFAIGGFDTRLRSGPLRPRHLASIERLDLRSCTSEASPPMSSQRSCAAVAALDGRLYVCGGFGGDVGPGPGPATRAAERFDPVVGRWETLPEMLEPRGAAGAAAVGGRLHVCGGMNPCTASAESYDPAARSWERMPSMAEARGWPVVVAAGARLHACGGFSDQRGSRENLSSVEAWSSASRSWSAAPRMTEPRLRAAGACVSGRLVVCGGEGAIGWLASAECLSPRASAWQRLPDMNGPRFGHFAVPVAGRLFVGGGLKGRSPGSECECFDPEANCWMPAADPPPTWCADRSNQAYSVLRLPSASPRRSMPALADAG